VNEVLIHEASGGLARLTLNRPERRNALSEALLVSLEETLRQIAADPSVRVVVIAGNGPVFCSGHDLAELAGLSEEESRQLFERCSRVMLGLRRLPQVVIARVHGVATAAGCQLVASSDLAIASQEATFATPGVKIGLFCTTPMIPLVRTIAPRAAMEMLLTGEPIDAHRALELGLVNRVVPTAQLDATIEALAATIISMSPHVISSGKRSFYDLLELDEPRAYERGTAIIAEKARSEDAREGISAFLQKRPPRWP
jgi:enoyl-CoA hydratase/carnithine racemase